MDREKTLEKFLEDNLCYSQNTINTYRFRIQNFFQFCDSELLNISRHDITGYLNQLQSQGKSPRTIRLTAAALKSFFSYCIEENIITVNPVQQIELPKIRRSLKKQISPSSLFNLREATKNNPKYRAIIEMLYTSGIRVSELINIKVENINWERNAVLIEYGKGHKQRYVLFTWECHYLLKRQLGTRNNGYLFVNQHNRKLTRQGIVYILNKIIAEAAVQDHVSPHSFRHTYATTLLERGAPIEIVGDLLGHINKESTRNYIHLTENARKEKYDEYF